MSRGTDIMRQEHLIIRRALKVLDAICSALEKKERVDPQHLRIIVDFITQYADSYHHVREENILLPMLSEEHQSHTSRHIGELLDEHLLHRGYVDAMVDALDSTVSSAPPPSFVSQARNLIGLLSEHILKEDQFLLPEADRLLSDEEQEILFRRLEDDLTADRQKQNTLHITNIEKLEKTYLEPTAQCCGCGLGT